VCVGNGGGVTMIMMLIIVLLLLLIIIIIMYTQELNSHTVRKARTIIENLVSGNLINC
jgi:uncharacterized membrane protein